MSLRDFGFGFGTLSGKRREIAIDPVTTDAGGAEAKRTLFSLQMVTSIEDYHSSHDIRREVSAGIGLFRAAPNQ